MVLNPAWRLAWFDAPGTDGEIWYLRSTVQKFLFRGPEVFEQASLVTPSKTLRRRGAVARTSMLGFPGGIRQVP